MTRNHTKSQQGVSGFCLLEEYKNIESEIGSTPTLAQLEEYGAYSADDFRAAFGSHSALVEAAQQPRNQILLAIRRERSKRGYTPKLAEVQESEERNIPDVWEHFDAWEEALEAAEVLPTADEIVEAIRREQANLGQVPNVSDFLDRTEYRRVDYLYHFDLWDDALRAARLDTGVDELYSEIRRITDNLGRTPTLAEFEESAPSAYAQYQSQGRHRHWSDRLWMETLDDAGVLPSRSDIIREIDHVVAEMDRLPSAGDFTDQTGIRGVVYEHYFGNWITALDATGVLPTREELVDHIRGLSDELQSIPNPSAILEKSKYSKLVYDHQFDSWKAAITAAGLVPSKAELWSQIRTVSEATASVPSKEAVVERGEYGAQTYEFQFSSWEQALETAGVLPSRADEDELYSEIRRITDNLGRTPTLAEFEESAPSAYAQYQSQGRHRHWSDRLWMETLDDAGVLPSRSDIIREIDHVVAEMDRLPSAGDFTDQTGIRGVVYEHYFGNWITALDATGVLPTREELVDHIRGLSDELQSIPNPSAILEKSKYSKLVYDHQFDSWKAAITAAGLVPSKAELWSQIRTVSEATASVPSKEAVVERGEYGAQTYEFQFSSWEQALETAGVLPSQAEFLSLVRGADSGSGWIDQGTVYGTDALPSEYHTQFFDSWEATLEAAGVLLSEEEFLSRPQSADDTTRWLDQDEFYRTSDLPSEYHTLFFSEEATADRHWASRQRVYEGTGIPTNYHTPFFGSWEELLEAGDLHLDRREFLSILREAEANNGWINQRRFYASNSLPSGYHERFFSPWATALDAAGILPSEEELLQHLRNLEPELGYTPSRSEAIEAGKYHGTIYRFRFGSWIETLDAAGLLPTRAELVSELQALADDVGRIPSKTDISESGEQQLDVYRHRFGSLGGALEAAGLLDQERS
jgi:hypothetical protein